MIRIPNGLVSIANNDEFIHDIRVVVVETLPRDAAVEFIAGVGIKNNETCESKLVEVALPNFFAATASL